jgi:hypothetical protein
MLSFTSLVIALGVSPVALIVQLQRDTVPAKNDTTLVAVSPARAGATADTTLASSLASPLFQHATLTALDTVRPRRRAVQMSDAAVLRLRIHRYASYATIPLFVVQAVAGNQLYQADKGGAERPSWAKTTHSVGAAGLGALFTVNTITGVWALWDQRENQDGRSRRWVHSVLMLGADAGFAYTGIKLAEDARRSSDSRDRHRQIAYISMGAALTSYGIMFFGNR